MLMLPRYEPANFNWPPENRSDLVTIGCRLNRSSVDVVRTHDCGNEQENRREEGTDEQNAPDADDGYESRPVPA